MVRKQKKLCFLHCFKGLQLQCIVSHATSWLVFICGMTLLLLRDLVCLAISYRLCLLFLYFLTPAPCKSGPELRVWDNNRSPWYQVTRQRREGRMTSNVNMASESPLHLCSHWLLVLLASLFFHILQLDQTVFPNTPSIFLLKGNLLFIALFRGMQGRMEDGKLMVSMATQSIKKTQENSLVVPWVSEVLWACRPR